ncbi:MAG: flagellar filament capping protein FliD, partial [Bacteroidota bacterium]
MDLLGTSGSGQTQTDMLVQSFRQTQQFRLDSLNSRKNDLEKRSSFFNNLNSRINSLVSAIDAFTADNASDKFITRKSSSSDTSVLSASANSEASLGVSQVRVNRLASRDMLVSSRLNNSGSFGGVSGTETITLTINGESKDINVEFDGTETNEQAMKKIAAAVNLDDEHGINATYIKDTSTTGRLTFVAAESGQDNSIQLSGSSILNNLGIAPGQVTQTGSSRTLTNGAGAGYRMADSAELNSEIEINGIQVTRDSNTIDDVLEGVTLNLKKPQEADELEVVVNTETDIDEIKSFIEPLLKNFNDTLKFLNSNKAQRRSDPAMESLYGRLRGMASQNLSNGDPDTFSYLMEVGISIGNDGTLSITDDAKLEEMIRDNPQKVAELFTSESGFA